MRERSHVIDLSAPIAPPALTLKGNPVTGGHRRRVHVLMEQQFWLWGCDVRRADGNLLMTFSASKTRPPSDATCKTSRYDLAIAPGRVISLWGFGLAVADDRLGTLVLPRYGFHPRCGECGADLGGCWDPRDFTERFAHPRTCDHERTMTLVPELFAWIARYERDVIATAGIAYRETTIRAWQRPVEPAIALPEAWDQLAREARHLARVAPERDRVA